MSVLVVDDDRPIVEGLRDFLEGEGYAVATAEDGRAPLDQLRRGFRPSVIVLDLMMPGMDGWDFRSEQLRDADLKDIPIIVISAAGFSEASVRTQFGDVDFLPKPVSLAQLVAAVHRRAPLH